MQGKISDLHAQVDEMKDALCDLKKSSRNAEAALTKEHSQVKDLKSHSKVESNASAPLPTTVVTAGPTTWVVVPACPCLSQRLGLLACPRLEMRWGSPPHPRRSTLGATLPWKWTMSTTGSWRRQDVSWWMAHCLSLRDSNAKDWAPQSTYWASIALKL